MDNHIIIARIIAKCKELVLQMKHGSAVVRELNTLKLEKLLKKLSDEFIKLVKEQENDRPKKR